MERSPLTKYTLSFSPVFLAFFCMLTVGINRSSAREWSNPDPFTQKCFVENKGQFTNPARKDDSTLFSLRAHGVEIYFNRNGITYRHVEVKKRPEELEDEDIGQEEELEKSYDATEHFAKMRWLNCNSHFQVLALDRTGNYFTYADLKDASGKSTIKAFGYKKIIYKNIYPLIDLEFSIPGDKTGFKYSFVLQPHADASQIKMHFDDHVVLDQDENAVIASSFGNIIDHAPVAYNEKGETITSQFIISDPNTVSFRLSKPEYSEKIIIDPWVKVPVFSGTDGAFDVNFDLLGNTYIYGGSFPFQLIKFDNAGALIWTHTTNGLGDTLFGYYGDFTVDMTTGTSYIGQGFRSDGARLIKVNSNGNLVATYAGNPNMREMWRLAYNYCTRNIVVGGGGTTSPTYQACYVDTSLAKINPKSIILPATAGTDIALTAADNSGNCYMMSVVPFKIDTNYLVKLSLPNLLPLSYQVVSGHTFREIGSVFYYYPTSSNGFNGMAIGSNFLLTYDGMTIKKWDSSNGSLISSTNVSPTQYSHGGLAVDNCDNILVGTGKNVKIYNSAFTLLSTTSLPDTVYDVVVDFNNTVYASGNKFVKTFSSGTGCAAVVPGSISGPGVSLELGNDTSLCGNAVINIDAGIGFSSYAWSTGETTQAISTSTGGVYAVQVQSASCILKDQKKIDYYNPVTLVVSDIGICEGQSWINLTATTTTGDSSTIFTWSPDSLMLYGSNTGPSVYALATASGYFYVEGVCGEKDSIHVSLAALPTITISPSTSLCINASTTVTAFGIKNYYWYSSPTYTNGTTNTIKINPNESEYYVSGTDSNNCPANWVYISVNKQPVITYSVDKDSACDRLCVQYNNTSTFLSTPVYTWSFGDNSTSATKSPAHCYNAPGVYDVSLIIKGKGGCADTLTKTKLIKVFASPITDFTYTPKLVTFYHSDVQFTDLSTFVNPIVNWNWDLGSNGDTSMMQHPSYTYPDHGTFTVRLVIIDTKGCRDTAYQTILIDPEYVFTAPNSFSPNGDNINDVFRVYSTVITSFSMSIFDRWGNLVFESGDVNSYWDGTAKNRKIAAPEDVYIYYIKTTDYNSQEHFYKGRVTLLR